MVANLVFFLTGLATFTSYGYIFFLQYVCLIKDFVIFAKNYAPMGEI